MIDLHGHYHVEPCGVRGTHRNLPTALAERVKVFVDGDRYRGVVAFDTHRGWVDFKRRDERGAFVMLAGVAQIERAHGRVRAIAAYVTPVEAGWLIGE